VILHPDVSRMSITSMNDAKFGQLPQSLSQKYDFSAFGTSLDTNPSRTIGDFEPDPAVQFPMHTPQALRYQWLPLSNSAHMEAPYVPIDPQLLLEDRLGAILYILLQMSLQLLETRCH
jgi:hypothetical protein